MTNEDGIPIVEAVTVRASCETCGRTYLLLTDNPYRPRHTYCALCWIQVLLLTGTTHGRTA